MTLVGYNNPILKQKSEDWIFDQDNINYDSDPEQLEQTMITVMQTNSGQGLAANQIGLLKRVFVIQLENRVPFAMFNPQLVKQSDEQQIGTEGCLSFPNLFLDVSRSKSIDIQYFNSKGEVKTDQLSDNDARCFLHELDHINGICFTDRISKLKLSMARKKQRKLHG